MEPFSISCTTCQAKLRVRDASAIGQIKTCPKCGSMVLIEAPPPGAGGGGLESRAPMAADATRTPPRPIPPGKKPSDFADTVDDPTHYGTTRDPGPLGAPSPPFGVTPPPLESTAAEPQESAEPPESPGMPSDEPAAEPLWMAPAEKTQRRWILAAGDRMAGVGLAIGAFVFLVSRRGDGVAENVPGVPPTTASPADLPAASTRSTTSGTSSIAEDPEKPVQPSSPPSAPPSSADSPPTAAPTAPATATPVTGVPAAGTSAPPDSPSAVEPPADPSAPTVPTAAETPHTADPASGLPPDLRPQPSDQGKADRMVPGGSLSDTLRRIGGLFDETAEAKPDEKPDGPATATPTESPSASPAEPPKLPRPAPRSVDVAARLADPILAIEFAETPLQDVLHAISTLSTIPITLVPDELVWLKLSPQSPVTIQLKDITVEKLLEAILSKWNLAAVQVDKQLVVARRTAEEGSLRKTQRSVADLIGTDPEQGDVLLDEITSLIAPETWVAAGGTGSARIVDGKLEVEQTNAVLLELGTFLERLRVARGVPKTSSFDERLFQPVSRTTRAAATLAKPITLNYPRPTSFPTILRRLGAEAGVSLLVDWHTVADAGWNPDAEVTFTVTAKPLGDVLRDLLQPMDLAYRIVDETILQVTTPEQLAAHSELEFYRVEGLLAAGMTPEAILERVREALPPAAEGASAVPLRIDLPSRCLLARLPQPQHQLLEPQLLEWQAAAKTN